MRIVQAALVFGALLYFALAAGNFFYFHILLLSSEGKYLPIDKFKLAIKIGYLSFLNPIQIYYDIFQKRSVLTKSLKYAKNWLNLKDGLEQMGHVNP